MTRTVYSVGEALRLPEVRAADRCSDLSADRPPDRQNTVPALPAPPNTEDTPMTTDDRALADRAAQQVFSRFSWETLTTPESLIARLRMCAEQAIADTRAADRLEAFHAKPPESDPVLAFEEYWGASKYRTRNMIGYSDKKCLAWEAFQQGRSVNLSHGEGQLACECGIGDQSDIGHYHESWCPALAALQSPPPVVSTPGVNCPNCGHRLPVGYAGPCVACDAPDVPDLNAPPVVEEGRREVVEKLWDEHIRLVGMDDGYAMALGKDKFFDAILALTPVEGVGEGRYRAYRDHVLDVDSHNTFQVVPVNRTDGDSLAISVAEAMNAALSTPVAAQGDVREALEQAREWICKTADKDEDPEQWSIIRTIDLSLATLGAPHEG